MEEGQQDVSECTTHHICDCQREELERLRDEVARLQNLLLEAQGLGRDSSANWSARNAGTMAIRKYWRTLAKLADS